MRDTRRALVVLCMLGASRAHADDGAALYDHLRWAVSGGAALYSMALRDADLSGAGPWLEATARNHKLALGIDYRRLSVDWSGPTGGDGVMHRFGAVGRYNLASCCHDHDPNEYEMIELFVETGAGVELIEWHDGGSLLRRTGQLGIGMRFGPRFKDTGRKYALEARFDALIAHRAPGYDPAPTCGGPCDGPSSPAAWDEGFMFSIGGMVGD